MQRDYLIDSMKRMNSRFGILMEYHLVVARITLLVTLQKCLTFNNRTIIINHI